MYLKDIVIYYDRSASDKIYASHFDYHVFFIRYYLSQQLKKKQIYNGWDIFSDQYTDWRSVQTYGNILECNRLLPKNR